MTHNRVTSLVACLESYLANCRRFGRTPEVVVMDDSVTDDTAGGGNPRVLAALRAVRRDDQIIRYAGPKQKRRFAEALARESSVSPHIIDFALFGDRRCDLFIGANRNGLLLDTVDARLFGADDDTLGRVATAPECQESIAFSSEYEPREFWFFPDRRSALEAVQLAEADLLAPHERFLGKTIGELPAGSRPLELSPAELAGRIVITLPGLLGDSGMGSPRFFLALDGASRERLLASSTAYSSALRSREVLRTVRQPTIAASAFCMTTFFGVDNSRLLPPFFPVARNSDGVFGLTVQRAIADSRVAFVPSVLLHAPPEPRAFAGDEAWTEPARMRMADVMISAILAHDTGDAADDGDRLRRLGTYLRELASLRSEEFEAFVTSAQQLRNLTLTALLETRLNQYGAAPAFWADDVRKTMDLLRRASGKKDYVVPRDLGIAGDVESARRLAQDLVAKFGELLETWPTLVEAARRLRTKGCRISEVV